MNKFLKFLLSRDGLVAVAAIVSLGVVAHFNPERPLVNFAARTGNLFVFLYILWRFAGQQIMTFFGNRRASIAADLENITLRRDEAEKQLADLEKRLSNLEIEREAILSDCHERAEAIKTSIITRAEKEAAAIIESAKRSAASLSQSELASLRAEIADEIGKTVENALRHDLTRAQQDALIDNSLKKVALQ